MLIVTLIPLTGKRNVQQKNLTIKQNVILTNMTKDQLVQLIIKQNAIIERYEAFAAEIIEELKARKKELEDWHQQSKDWEIENQKLCLKL